MTASVAAWRTAHETGLASQLCDRIVRERDVPDRLWRALAQGRTTPRRQTERTGRMPGRPGPSAPLHGPDLYVAALLAAGWRDCQIAVHLGVTENAARDRVQAMARHAGARPGPCARTEAVARWLRHELEAAA